MTTAQINAADLAVLLPMLYFPANTTEGKLLKAVSNVPHDRLCSFLNEFSQETILDVLSTAAADYETSILPALEKLAESHGLPMEITGLSVSKDGCITLRIGRIDYHTIVSNYHPLIREGGLHIAAGNPILRNLFNMLSLSLRAGLTVLSRIPAKTLDTLMVGLINCNAGILLEKLNSILEENGFSLRLANLYAEE